MPPGKIPFNCEIVSQHGWPGSKVFDDIQSVFYLGQEAFGHVSLMSEMRTEIFIGKALYFMFIPVMTFSLLGVLSIFPGYGWKQLVTICVDVFGLSLIFFILSRWVDKKLDDKYNGFWSELCPEAGFSRRAKMRRLGL